MTNKLPYRIVVTGPESTGKTRTSQDLAHALHTLWVPEYARDYLSRLSHPYQEEDLERIAQGQIESEESLAAQVRDYLVCDTDLYVIKIWSEYKYNRCSRWILEAIAQRSYDLYLLGYPDIEWEDDPLREHPDPRDRARLFQYYLDHMMNSGVPFRVLRGDPEQRLSQAMSTLREQGIIS